MEPVAAVGPWVGKAVGRRFRSPAMLEGVQDGQDFRSGFVGAAGLAAIAAVRGHTALSVPTHRSGGSGGEAGQRGTEGLEALHDHFHCSEGMVQQDIQDPLGSVGQDSDDAGVGAESVAARTARCSAPLDSPG